MSFPGEANLKAPGPKIYQVGTEGGFLPAVAVHPNSISCLDLKADSTGNTAKPVSYTHLVERSTRFGFLPMTACCGTLQSCSFSQ